jgi:hypothetical protein
VSKMILPLDGREYHDPTSGTPVRITPNDAYFLIGNYGFECHPTGKPWMFGVTTMKVGPFVSILPMNSNFFKDIAKKNAGVEKEKMVVPLENCLDITALSPQNNIKTGLFKLDYGHHVHPFEKVKKNEYLIDETAPDWFNHDIQFGKIGYHIARGLGMKMVGHLLDEARAREQRKTAPVLSPA